MRPGWQKNGWRTRRTQQGLTLAEVLVAFLVSGLALAGLVTGYILANTASQKSSISLSASAQASQWMEQMRGAKWDISSWPVIDQLTVTNFSNEVVMLEFSGNGTNLIYATNYATITTVSTNPPLRRIRVDCVWNYRGLQTFTNTIETFRAPDQ